MKKTNTALAILSVMFLYGCAGVADRQLTKPNVPKESNQVRGMVEEMRVENPVDKKDLSRITTAPKDEDRVKDLFTKQGVSDPTVFSHPKWKPSKVSTSLNGVQITDFFALMGQVSNLNFIVGQEVQGEVSVSIKDMNWTEVVETVMSTKRLVSFISEDGKNVRIHSVDFSNERSDTLKKVLSQRIEEQRARESLVQKDTAIIRVFYSKADTVAKMLREMLAGVETRGPAGTPGGAATGGVSNRALFTVDVRTNSIVVQASAQDLDWIKKTISTIDKPSKQVLVEAFIVEGRDNFTQELGTRLGVQGTNKGQARFYDGVAGTTVTAVDELNAATKVIGSVSNPMTSTSSVGGLGMVFGGNTSTIRMELLGMERDGLTKIISNPRLFIIDNEQASITDGVQIPYPVAGTGANQITYEFKDAALKLDVKPSIVGDGNIYIEVVVNKDSPNYATTPPAIDKREVRTKLLIKDGGIAMLGGINSATISSTDNLVPVLGNIPILGNLFKGTAQNNDRRQLFIFLAPSAL
jgi:type IV pilus assembly protein PilQ